MDTYSLSLLAALAEKGVRVDFLSDDERTMSGIARRPGVSFFSLGGKRRANLSKGEKAARVLRYYKNLVAYAYRSDAEVFHILWLNKFLFFDRTLLALYYRALGKKLVFTAHNINAGERDGTDGFLNRVSLRYLYRDMDHIFVHTEKMRRQLVEEFQADAERVSIVRFGYNDMTPRTDLDREAARKRLGLKDDEKVMLFFGNIAPYKGLDCLVSAMALLKGKVAGLRLIIAGNVKKECDAYWADVRRLIDQSALKESILFHIRFVPEEELEVFHKASDVMILPYRHIFQSGVLFLSYTFGLPVIVSDVGELKEDVVEGRTGYVFRPNDPEDLAAKIEAYFSSDLYEGLEKYRGDIIERVRTNNSWEKVAEATDEVYRRLA